jgi:hypothetical protein
MLRLFEAHREAEAARDVDAILGTFVEDCFLETMALGLRAEGKDAVKAAYEAQYFIAFPDLDPDDQGMAFGDDVMVVWGSLRGTSKGEWLGVPPGGGSFAVPFANVVPFKDGLLRPRHALRTGGDKHRPGPSGCQGASAERLRITSAPEGWLERDLVPRSQGSDGGRASASREEQQRHK